MCIWCWYEPNSFNSYSLKLNFLFETHGSFYTSHQSTMGRASCLLNYYKLWLEFHDRLPIPQFVVQYIDVYD